MCTLWFLNQHKSVLWRHKGSLSPPPWFPPEACRIITPLRSKPFCQSAWTSWSTSKVVHGEGRHDPKNFIDLKKCSKKTRQLCSFLQLHWEVEHALVPLRTALREMQKNPTEFPSLNFLLNKEEREEEYDKGTQHHRHFKNSFWENSMTQNSCSQMRKLTVVFSTATLSVEFVVVFCGCWDSKDPELANQLTESKNKTPSPPTPPLKSLDCYSRIEMLFLN